MEQKFASSGVGNEECLQLLSVPLAVPGGLHNPLHEVHKHVPHFLGGVEGSGDGAEGPGKEFEIGLCLCNGTTTNFAQLAQTQTFELFFSVIEMFEFSKLEEILFVEGHIFAGLFGNIIGAPTVHHGKGAAVQVLKCHVV